MSSAVLHEALQAGNMHTRLHAHLSVHVTRSRLHWHALVTIVNLVH